MTKLVVITGASSGIRQALAIGFANSGFTSSENFNKRKNNA